MTAVLLFGGQGGQQPGMFGRWGHLEAVRENIDLACEVLEEDAWGWDSVEALRGTRAVQLSLLVLQTGVARTLIEEGLDVSYAAGHSLGAWSAAVASCALSLVDALRLVSIRASGMAAAAPHGYGMIAVLGLSEAALRRVVSEVNSAGGEAWLSNLNAPTQITVSGADEALRDVAQLAQQAGAQKVVRLKVAVPAHSPLMAPARKHLDEAMQGIALRAPHFPLLANSTGKLLRQAQSIKQDLVVSTDRPVRWGPGVAALAERGIRQWIQVPPGRQLIGMLPHDEHPADAWCVDNVGLTDTLVKAKR